MSQEQKSRPAPEKFNVQCGTNRLFSLFEETEGILEAEERSIFRLAKKYDAFKLIRRATEKPKIP